MPRRQGQYRKKIDTVHWGYGSFAVQGLAAGTSAVNVFSAEHMPQTFLRTRGEWTAYLDGLAVVGTLVSVGIGLILVPEGTGTTVLWSPITDGDAPWLWVDYAMLGYEEMVADVIDVPGMTAVRRVIDSKAMRKVRNTEMQCVIENATVGGAEQVNVAGQVRVLSGQ